MNISLDSVLADINNNKLGPNYYLTKTYIFPLAVYFSPQLAFVMEFSKDESERIIEVTQLNETKLFQGNVAPSLIINRCYGKIFTADSIKYSVTLAFLSVSGLLIG